MGKVVKFQDYRRPKKSARDEVKEMLAITTPYNTEIVWNEGLDRLERFLKDETSQPDQDETLSS